MFTIGDIFEIIDDRILYHKSRINIAEAEELEVLRSIFEKLESIKTEIRRNQNE